MHYNHLLLTSARNKKEAISNVQGFLDDHYQAVFDRYAFGGKWSWNNQKDSNKKSKLDEVIDAEHPQFFKRIEAARQLINSDKNRLLKAIKSCFDMQELYESLTDPLVYERLRSGLISGYALHKLFSDHFYDDHYTRGKFFFNIEDYSTKYNRKRIEEEPKNWFLANMDLHF